MKLNCLVVLAVTIILLAGGVAEGAEGSEPAKASHGEELGRLLDLVVKDAAAKLMDSENPGGDGVILIVDGESPLREELESLMLVQLLSAGAVLFDEKIQAGEDSTCSMNLLEVKVLKAGVRYLSWRRVLGLGPARISCSYEVSIKTKLIDGASGRILMAATSCADYEREIPLRDIERISDDGEWSVDEPPDVSSPMETILIIGLLIGMAWIFSSGE